MTEAEQRQWLKVDSCWKDLRRLRHSFAVIEEERDHLEEAIRQLEIIKQLLEEKC